jgi:hypothetical protein
MQFINSFIMLISNINAMLIAINNSFISRSQKSLIFTAD